MDASVCEKQLLADSDLFQILHSQMCCSTVTWKWMFVTQAKRKVSTDNYQALFNSLSLCIKYYKK